MDPVGLDQIWILTHTFLRSSRSLEGRGADTRVRIISLPLARRHPNLGPTLAEPSPDQSNHLSLDTGKR